MGGNRNFYRCLCGWRAESAASRLCPHPIEGNSFLGKASAPGQGAHRLRPLGFGGPSRLQSRGVGCNEGHLTGPGCEGRGRKGCPSEKAF